jgi:hypothetical protein
LTYTSCQESDRRVYAALRGDIDLGPATDLRNWSVAQLGFALKVRMFERKRLDRLGRRLDRRRRRRGAKGDAGGCTPETDS